MRFTTPTRRSNWKTCTLAALLALTARSQESFVLPEPAEITVFANRVNLRSQPGDYGEVIGQVNYGDKLLATEVGPEWVRILPPTGSTFWVHKPFLTGGEVNVTVLNVRSGAGVEHSVVGQYSRGDKVEVIGEKGDWAQIKPGPGLSLWISKSLVKLPASTLNLRPAPAPEAAPALIAPTPPALEPMPAPAPTPAPETEPVPTPAPDAEVPAPPAPENLPDIVIVPPSPDPAPVQPVEDVQPERRAPPAPSDLNLVPLPGQGAPASRQGFLRYYLLKGDSPSRYYLVVKVPGQEETVCYVRDEGDRLRGFTGKRVMIRGWDFWVQGKNLPVMVPDTIEPVETGR